MDAKGAVFPDHGDVRLLLGEDTDRNTKSQQGFDARDIFFIGLRVVVPVGDIKAGVFTVILPSCSIDAVDIRNQGRPLQELFRVFRVKVIWYFKLFHASSVSVSV